MSQPNPVQLQKFLGGVDYPCSRDDLVQYARGNGAPDEVLQQLQDLPEQTYNGPDDVSGAYS
jgi:hypothetical protein